MARPGLHLNAEAYDDLWANLEALKAAAESDAHAEETLHDWRSEIRQMYWAVRQAKQDAETNAYLRKAVPRDTQRARVYRAEGMVDDLGNLMGSHSQQAYLNSVLGADWFARAFPELPVGSVVVVRAANQKRSCYTRRLGRHTLELVDGASKGTVLHELAHAMHRVWYGQGAGGHDANFVGMLLWLYVLALGKPTGRRLAQGIIVAGVKYTQLHKQARTQPAPAVNPIRRIAQEAR